MMHTREDSICWTIKISKTSPITVHYWWRHSEIVTNYRTNAVHSLPPSHLHDAYLGGFAMRTVKMALLIVIFFTLEFLQNKLFGRTCKKNWKQVQKKNTKLYGIAVFEGRTPPSPQPPTHPPSDHYHSYR
jgi:hypothetical protein